MKVKIKHRSKFSNLSNWKEEAWKNQGFNGIQTCDLRKYRCDALPTELWSHTLRARSIYWVHIFPCSEMMSSLYENNSNNMNNMNYYHINFTQCSVACVKWWTVHTILLPVGLLCSLTTFVQEKMYQYNLQLQCLTVSEQFKFVRLTLVIASGYKQYLLSFKIKKVKTKYLLNFVNWFLCFHNYNLYDTCHFPMLEQDAVQSNCTNVQGTTVTPEWQSLCPADFGDVIMFCEFIKVFIEFL